MMHHLLDELRDIIRLNVADECCRLRALVIVDMVHRNACKGPAEPQSLSEVFPTPTISSRSENLVVADVCDTPFSVDSINFNFQASRGNENDALLQCMDLGGMTVSDERISSKSKRGDAKLKESVLSSFNEELDESCQRSQRRRRRASLTVISASEMNIKRNRITNIAHDASEKSKDTSIVEEQPSHERAEDISRKDSAIDIQCSDERIFSGLPDASVDYPGPDKDETMNDISSMQVSGWVVEDEAMVEQERSSTVDDKVHAQLSALEVCARADKIKSQPARNRRKSISAGKHAKLKKSVLQSVLENNDLYNSDSLEGGGHGDVESAYEPSPLEESLKTENLLDERRGHPSTDSGPPEVNVLSADSADCTSVRCVPVAEDSEVTAPQANRRMLYNPTLSGLSNEWTEDDEQSQLDQHVSPTAQTDSALETLGENNCVNIKFDEPDIVNEEIVEAPSPEKFTFCTLSSSFSASRAMGYLRASPSELLQTASGLVIIACLEAILGTVDFCSDDEYYELGSSLASICEHMNTCNIIPRLKLDASCTDFGKTRKRVRFKTMGCSDENCVSPPNDRRPETLSSVDTICRELSDFIFSVDQFEHKFERSDSNAIRLRQVFIGFLRLISSSADECLLAMQLIGQDCICDLSALHLPDDTPENSVNIKVIMKTASIMESEIFGRNGGEERYDVYVWDPEAKISNVHFKVEQKISSELRHQVAWMATSAIRSRLRWLLDDFPPCYSKPAVTGCIKYEDSRSGLFKLLIRSGPSAGFVGEKPRGLKLTIPGGNIAPSMGSRRQSEIVYDFPLSYLLTSALRQLYDGIVFAYLLQGAESVSPTAVSIIADGTQQYDERKSFVNLLRARASTEVNSECIVGRIECAQLILAVEAARRFVANLISIPLVYSVGVEGGVWAILEEFGSVVAKIGQKEDCHFALFSSMQLLEQFVSEPFFEQELLVLAKTSLGKKLIIDRGIRAGHGVSLEGSALLGYADPVKYIKDAMSCCSYIYYFPEVAMNCSSEEHQGQ